MLIILSTEKPGFIFYVHLTLKRKEFITFTLITFFIVV